MRPAYQAIVAVVLLAGATPAARLRAQVTGRVTADSTSSPIPGAQLELWSATGLVARGESGADGGFSLPGPSGGRSLRLLARRIGFAPVTLDGVRSGVVVTVAMRALPVALPELTVASCGGPDDAVSRRLWDSMRVRYRLVDTIPWRANLSFSREERTTRDSVGVAAHEQWIGTGGYTDLGTRFQRRFIERYGYAVPLKPGSSLGFGWERGAVEYVRLDMNAAEHFVDSQFGALHVFLTARYEDGLVVIAFCPRATGRAEIEGAISLVPGGGIASAWWRFVMRHSPEDAGGQVFFAPPSDTGPGYAVPARGVFWRHPHDTQWYYQVIRVYDAWGPSRAWPFRRE